MRIFEVLSQNDELYHSTSDDNAINILRNRIIYPSFDHIDDEENFDYFVSTTTDINLKFFREWPGSGNVTFVFNKPKIEAAGYQTKNINRWDEVRILLKNGDIGLPISLIEKIIIFGDHKNPYFKGFVHDLDFDFDPNAEEKYQKLKQNELSPRGEFVGNKNPYSIIKILAQKNNIPVIDKRYPVK